MAMDTHASLHDGNLHSIHVELGESTSIVIMLSFYENPNERKRSDATLTFTNVTSFSNVVDFKRQAEHARFGNISDWVPARRRGTTFIHLAAGTMSIFSDPPVLLVSNSGV